MAFGSQISIEGKLCTIILLATTVLSKLPSTKDVYGLALLYAKQVIVPSWQRRRQLMSQNILKKYLCGLTNS